MRRYYLHRLCLCLSVMTLGCIVIGSTQAEPLIPSRNTMIELHNKTDKTLYLTHHSLSSGAWTPKLKPPPEIKPGAKMIWKSEASGVANLSDVAGKVSYSIGNASWNSPFGIAPANAARKQSSLLTLSRYAEQLDTYYIAADGSIQNVWWSAKENKWSTPGPATSAGATRADSPLTGVCRASGHIDFFWITPKGEIASRALANNKWSGNAFNITGPDVAYRQTDLVAVSSQQNWIDVFWVGKDRAVYSCSWRGSTWNKPVSHTPANSVRDGSSLTAITRTKDEIHVFYSNKEGAIATVWWRGKWNGPAQITAKSTVADGSSLAAVAMDSKHLAVFWENKEGALCTNYQHNDQNGGKWHEMHAISAAKAVRPRSPITAHNRTSTHMDVFWHSPDGTVMTSYFQAGGAWNKPFGITSPGVVRADSSMTALSRVNHHVDVFWIDGKGGVATNWWDSKVVQDISIRWTNPTVESQYGNKYYEHAPTGYALSHTGGQGGEAKAYYVLEKSAKRMVKDFLPSKHGFKFGNDYWDKNNIKLPVVTLDFPKPIGKVTLTHSGQGLCGGMVYTVMDYFYAGQILPPRTVGPVNENDELYKYLRERLKTSFDITGTGLNYFNYMRPDYPDTDDSTSGAVLRQKGRSFIIAKEEWPKIKADIDANKLSPIGLVQIKSINPGDLGKNHQVLVYGYLLSGDVVTLYYYDPTYPNEDRMQLLFSIGQLDKPIKIQRYIGGDVKDKTITTFFRTNYKPAPASLAKPKG